MTIDEAIDEFLNRYVPPNNRDWAEPTLRVLVTMAETRAQIRFIGELRANEQRGPNEPA